MSHLKDEIDANRSKFFDRWTSESCKNWQSLKENAVFTDSYRRLTAIQAIKMHIVVKNYSQGSAEFFHEAHNDALIAHVNASIGSWRTALQSLRSVIENVLCAIYYNDHPIELELWESGQFVVGFSELIKYMEKHPRLSSTPRTVSGLEIIQSEYGTLSKAVHGSAAGFRMTDSLTNVLLWSDDPKKASMWSTREKKTVEGLLLLLIALHSPLLEGARLPGLREVIGLGVSTASRKLLKSHLKVSIPAP